MWSLRFGMWSLRLQNWDLSQKIRNTYSATNKQNNQIEIQHARREWIIVCKVDDSQSFPTIEQLFQKLCWFRHVDEWPCRVLGVICMNSWILVLFVFWLWVWCVCVGASFCSFVVLESLLHYHDEAVMVAATLLIQKTTRGVSFRSPARTKIDMFCLRHFSRFSCHALFARDSDCGFWPPKTCSKMISPSNFTMVTPARPKTITHQHRHSEPASQSVSQPASQPARELNHPVNNLAR